MGDAELSNLGGVGALPGLDLQFVMELLAGLFLFHLRAGSTGRLDKWVMLHYQI